MDKLNRSKRAVKGTITKLETFVEESSSHTPTKLDIKLKRVQEKNKKIDELKDQYYGTKDISDSELAEIEADLQEMEDRLENLEEYIDLKHMQLVVDPLETNISYFLPHHGFRPDSKTTTLRVVFNASSKTTSGLSLIDILYKGEVLQQDLFSLLLRFRQHTFVFTTDISKMFRQILINPDHRDLQIILWKDSADGPVKTYKLNTVTYGITCASYLATWTIQQLARDEAENYPLAAAVTIRDIYMDDILTGSSDFQEFQLLQSELIGLFKKAGMSLHKWCSNAPEILTSIPKEEQSWDFHCQSSDKIIKTLGVIWNPQFDYFSFKTVVNCQDSYTKREVLSIIARLFDPIGFIGSILTKAKLLLPKLWVLKLE
ncbi:DUF1758 domain-containing protein [Trichonephila clavata]|uniref:DUF1758 domain-containing protein n=1 Tax=Trichonephila clavata TaxID=2740835 RepID=A0A8X6KS36_TRICU|nr:DUF1758 domain-containing protein [Trichonephila clavata]